MMNGQKGKKNLHLVIVQLKELKIEIDRQQREQEVAMSLESSYFQEVA